MLAAVVFCLSGLAALVYGADLISRGGAALAARLRVPPVVVGGTVVAIGTSTPELAVGIEASVRGTGALAVGNVAGANLINLLLLLGLSAALRPIPLRPKLLTLELPAMVAAAFALALFGADGRLSVPEGALLVVAMIVYSTAIGRRSLAQARRWRLEPDPPDSVAREGGGIARTLAMAVLGIALALAGAEVFVDGVAALAHIWGVSSAFIGVTVVALGTTSPELATIVMSMVRNQRDIGLGALLGSSFYNITLVLGASSLAAGEGLPLPAELSRVDIPAMAFATLVCALVCVTRRRIGRLEGLGLMAAYLGFLGYTIAGRT